MPDNVILVPSTSMDGNKKPGRDENNLARMAKITRSYLKLDSKNIVLSGEKVIELEPFIAFTSDIRKIITMLDSNELTEADVLRVCFVTTSNFKALGGTGKSLECALIDDYFDKLYIGTDPELLFMDKGVVVHANKIQGFGGTYKFGVDGPMAELRPDPSYTPEGLVENIKSILNNEAATSKIKDIDWLSACYYENALRDFPVGTHIHIDNPPQIAKLDAGEYLGPKKTGNNSPRHRLFAVTNRIMDELLTLPMIRLDGNVGHNRRAHCKMSAANGFTSAHYGKGYGFFGEWRPARGRFEFRSLSGLVLMNPDISTAVFGTAKAIAEAVYKDAIANKLDSNYILPAEFSDKGIYEYEFNDWAKIPLAEKFGCVGCSKDITDTMNNSSRNEISPKYIQQWLVRMRKLPTYTQYEDYIEGLGDLLSCSAKVLDGFGKNVKKEWKE